MSTDPNAMYLALMESIRARLDFAEGLALGTGDEFSRAESAAFHCRKVIEGIAFGCLVATHHGFKHVPRDATGKWNASQIFQGLQKKSLDVFPSPSNIRFATAEEQAANNVKIVIDGIPGRRLSHNELIKIYERLHRWLHEINPYVSVDRKIFLANHGSQLWADIRSVNDFIERHFISIQGEAFFCVLRDEVDGYTKVESFSKIANL